jgi:hypothetical protein
MSPRKANPSVRSDGELTPGTAQVPGAGQPNGRGPRPAVTQALAGAGAGAPMPQGMQGQLQQDAAATPAPPGVSDAAHAAHVAARGYQHNVTPLFAPTERPWEHVTAGAPLAPGPTNPMAMPMPGQDNASIASILENAAEASGSPTLQALADRANATSSTGGAPPQAVGGP